MKIIKGLPFELIFWITALLLLGTADVHDHSGAHFTLCPLANMGLTWCPGCGIGRSIAHLLQGNFGESFKQHWFGLPALLILCSRIVTLIKLNLKSSRILNLKNKEEGYV
ncbi:MAG: DUF2752 domain-containing protein [Candidatus Pedobacter colombiensis]|uniref:DUF2752 domain-containing protein n=1 Tax=Candidatus Pedobacter colombiensis TaxID=3121371 RepID=A0AAJ5W6B7_9SPHI|nr:DUF2752 domain-containing protein [Pedobacter sp.]WEK19343.1 MAG: DUF2752 domain-containing protein [Pedobacter sp.]